MDYYFSKDKAMWIHGHDSIKNFYWCKVMSKVELMNPKTLVSDSVRKAQKFFISSYTLIFQTDENAKYFMQSIPQTQCYLCPNEIIQIKSNGVSKLLICYS